MGQMQITVSDCKKFNTTFKWECDGEQLQNTVEFIQEVANQSGIAPDAFCRNALVHLPSMGWLEHDGSRHVQAMAIANFIMHEFEQGALR